MHATRAYEAQARTTQACTASACTAGTRSASMGDASATTQACTAPAQSTGRRTPAMSTTLTSGCRTIGRTLHKCTTRPARRRTARARTAWARAVGMGSSTHMSTTNCTGHRAHSTGTQACAAREHRAKTRSARTARVRRGRAGGSCTHMVHVCHVVFRLCVPGAAAMPPPTGSARQGNGRDQSARLRRSRAASVVHALPPLSAPGPGRRTAPPHRPRWVRPRRRRSSAAPPNAHAADHQACHHGAGRPTHARVRPRPPLPPPTHSAPVCPIFHSSSPAERNVSSLALMAATTGHRDLGRLSSPPSHIGPSNACPRAAPETTPLWRLFQKALSLPSPPFFDQFPPVATRQSHRFLEKTLWCSRPPFWMKATRNATLRSQQIHF
jgi:hypothetical protein